MKAQAENTSSSGSAEAPVTFMKWHRYVLGFCLVIFALELGVVLLVFPWLRNWDLSWIAMQSQRFSNIWMSRYFRGALSGLGLLNLYVAFFELTKLLRAIFNR